MKHYLTIEKSGFKFVCSIPSETRETLEFKVDVMMGARTVNTFAVPMTREPRGTQVDMADTIALQWELDRFIERDKGRGTKKRVR